MIVNGVNIRELYNINSIENVQSISTRGILSYNRAKKIPHVSIASSVIQTKRNKKVPNGLHLQDYACLYFSVRNPMMYVLERVKRIENLCILRISEDILNHQDIIITDMNAASEYVKFLSISEINQLNFNLIFDRTWDSPDMIDKFRRKSIKCAEVLIKDRIHQDYIIGAYVKNKNSKTKLENNGFRKEIIINKDLFFR